MRKKREWGDKRVKRNNTVKAAIIGIRQTMVTKEILKINEVKAKRRKLGS